MRNFKVIKAKSGEEVCRCGSAKSARRWADRQTEEHLIIHLTPDGPRQIEPSATHEEGIK